MLERAPRRRLAATVALAALVATPLALGAGSLSESTSASPTFSVTLNGSNQTTTYTLPISVVDSRGTGLGWNLTITSTRFTNGAQSLSTNASQVTSVSSSCAVAPCVNPINSVGYPVTVPAGTAPPAAVKFYNAALLTGLGSFTITPTIRVSVPANTFKGTYTSTITLAIASGP